jgi:hypothetical protein
MGLQTQNEDNKPQSEANPFGREENQLVAKAVMTIVKPNADILPKDIYLLRDNSSLLNSNGRFKQNANVPDSTKETYAYLFENHKRHPVLALDQHIWSPSNLRCESQELER